MLCVVSLALALHAPAPGVTRASATGRLASTPRCLDIASIDPAVALSALAIAGGGAYYFTTKDSSPAKPKPSPKAKGSAMKGGSAGSHRMAGRWPKPPPRELWSPPPDWTPPTKPVLSWYDMGLRLSAPAPAPPSALAPPKRKRDMLGDLWRSVFGTTETEATAAPRPAARTASWPSLGGAGGSHRMAGRWPPPKLEVVAPPPAPVAAPATPKTSVYSWYDSGKRL